MPPTLPSFNPARLRTYVFRLPLFTRCAVLIIIFLWVLSLQLLWDERQTLSLVPDEIGLTGGMYRINTYPLVHIGFFHMLLNTLALAPLLERFEAEHGTLLSLALFAGPLSTLPAGLYLLWEKAIWRANTPVMGASIWVFVLLGIEAMKTYRSNPYFIWARIPEDPSAPREDSTMDRGEAKLIGEVTALRFYRPENIWEVRCPPYDVDSDLGAQRGGRYPDRVNGVYTEVRAIVLYAWVTLRFHYVRIGLGLVESSE
ncbi:MAG: putative rhomboid protease [Vezdaea acicularis]|nr:MAG: putative rhomboid protease [Vezdaea acicularis]